MIDALKDSEIALLEARLESPGADELVIRGIENALSAVRYALKRSATLSPGTGNGPKPVVK